MTISNSQTQSPSIPSRANIAKRTLHYYWLITKQKIGFFVLGIIATIGFVGLLTYANTYVMGLIVDKVQSTAAPDGTSLITSDGVWNEFGGFIIALILINLIGQLCSKLQDYAIFKLEIQR